MRNVVLLVSFPRSLFNAYAGTTGNEPPLRTPLCVSHRLLRASVFSDPSPRGGYLCLTIFCLACPTRPGTVVPPSFTTSPLRQGQIGSPVYSLPMVNGQNNIPLSSCFISCTLMLPFDPLLYLTP
ncbi:hypothetical protein F5148DRAFT_1186768 [Russula earlei]|uniref:Uncharacterized protein n=1 Tax=Russula earlei TaxID=71964 RepID=A0ACC0UES5_9AGAM|nr:hypothetical protein F5148DRAFT_1186768 [Russula earlei]